MTAQQRSGIIIGTVTDTTDAILPGAQIKISPTSLTAVANNLGEFSITGVQPGAYAVTVTYLGFNSATLNVTVTAGQQVKVSPALRPGQTEQVTVSAGRSFGEAQSLNEMQTSDNILNVLPANVIASLPNANIADAVGRLPGVTLERDEGEGKYVQIRGTEPRLSNLTIDGMNVPSPEPGIRQVKLDVIPADLVESVQIYKTLQANQEGDAIGGSVNIVTKTASDKPTLSLYGAGGFTPIDGNVPVSEFAGTVGKRFGKTKRLGVILSGTYDYNGRGIDDIEPVPGVAADGTTPVFALIDLRQYLYDRSRYGFGGAVDYKLSDTSSIYVRGIFSDFKDYGHRWDYALQDNGGAPGGNLPSLTTERRLPDFQVASLTLGGNHAFSTSWVNWGINASRSRMLNPINGGESITTFVYVDPTIPGNSQANNTSTSNCQYDPGANKSIYRPQFTAACFTEAYNPDNMQLANIAHSDHGLSAQLNLQGQVAAAKNYHFGKHFGIVEIGAKLRNSHKFDDSFQNVYIPNVAITETQFVNGFKNNNYYDGSYKYGPTPDWEGVNAYLKNNPGQFSLDPVNTTVAPVLGGNANNFNLDERVSAGYITNTLDFGKFALIGGLRVEGTQVRTVSYNINTGTFDFKGSGSYVSFLPDVSLNYRLDKESALRLVYGRGISRPDPQFLTASISIDNSTVPPTITVGNPNLKPEHSNSFDALYEHYLDHLGVVQAGFFYKMLSDPIVTVQSTPTTGPYVGNLLNQATNSGSAYISGIELNFQQHFTYLPGLFGGLGLSANYSYTTSQATDVNPGNRTDSPAMLRQAPNTWNVSPTYDRGHLSLRVGMAYNGPNIFLYQYIDGSPGGLHGPVGDVYQYSHFQVDAQASYGLGKGLSAIVSALNLNNEAFGFYNGAPQFMIQREYYKPTYTFGFRWNPTKD